MSIEPITPTAITSPQSIETKWARMRYWLLPLLTLTLSLLTIQSCGLDIEDPNPPSPPVWVEKSFPEEWPERGIDAHESGGIFMEWEINPIGENVTSYLLRRAQYFELNDSLGDFQLLKTLVPESSSRLEYIDRESTTYTRYYYVLIAENYAGNQSLPSDTIGYMRFAAMNSALMHPNGLSVHLETDRKLQWAYNYHVAMENYTITIVAADSGFVLRRELTPGNFIGATEYFAIADTIDFLSGGIYKWRVDMGGQYAEGRETAGSESRWATFRYVAP